MQPGSARSQNSDWESPLLEIDGGEVAELSHRLREDRRFGGALQIESMAESRFDLESGSSDTLTLEPRLELALAYAPEGGMSLYAQLELSKSIFLQGGNGDSDENARAELRQAYVLMDGSVPGLSFQIGRQRFEDERDWWYDEDLDAARVRYQRGRFGFELAASRNENPSRDALNRDRTKTGKNILAVGRYAYADEAELGVYTIAQDASSEVDEKPLFVGLRSIGMFGSSISHWIDAAIVKGTDAGRDIRAYGFDVGIDYLFEAPLQPSLHLGLAFGSGDRDPKDEVDSAFRQTGLQSSYFYYGEVLAPELSNMWIHTIGFELDSSGRTSIRVLYHHYRQHRAAAHFATP